MISTLRETDDADETTQLVSDCANLLNDAAPAATEAALDVRQALREELLSSLWGAADGSASAADDGDATGVYAAPEAAVVALIAPTAAVLEVLEYSGSRSAEVSATAAYSAAQIATAASAALDVTAESAAEGAGATLRSDSSAALDVLSSAVAVVPGGEVGAAAVRAIISVRRSSHSRRREQRRCWRPRLRRRWRNTTARDRSWSIALGVATARICGRTSHPTLRYADHRCAAQALRRARFPTNSSHSTSSPQRPAADVKDSARRRRRRGAGHVVHRCASAACAAGSVTRHFSRCLA